MHFFFLSCSKTPLKRSSMTTFVLFFFGRLKRGSDLSLAKRGSDIVRRLDENWSLKIGFGYIVTCGLSRCATIIMIMDGNLGNGCRQHGAC